MTRDFSAILGLLSRYFEKIHLVTLVVTICNARKKKKSAEKKRGSVINRARSLFADPRWTGRPPPGTRPWWNRPTRSESLRRPRQSGQRSTGRRKGPSRRPWSPRPPTLETRPAGCRRGRPAGRRRGTSRLPLRLLLRRPLPRPTTPSCLPSSRTSWR